MQHRAARVRDVRVRAVLEQHRRQLVVRVDHRHAERAGTVRRRLVHVGVRGEQRARRVDVPFADGEQQRGEAALRSQGNVGASAREQLHRRRVPFGRRPHQRGLSPPRFLGVDVDVVGDDGGERVRNADPRRNHQRSLALRRRAVRIGAGRDQQLDHRGVGVGGGDQERRDAVAVRRRRRRAGLEQQIGGFEVVQVHRVVQRRRAVRGGAVRVAVLVQRRAQRGDIRRANRVQHRQVGGARRSAREHEDEQPDHASALHQSSPSRIAPGPVPCGLG